MDEEERGELKGGRNKGSGAGVWSRSVRGLRSLSGKVASQAR